MMITLLFCVCFLISTCLASTTSLTVDNIKLRTADNNWLVLYYQSSPNTIETSWNTLAKNYKDWNQHGVFFGQVDCSSEKQLCDDIQGDTVVVVYSAGNPVTTYNVDSQEQLDDFVRQQIVSAPLRGSVTLTKDWLETIESTGQPWFVKYYAPWCGHCKKMAPVWDSLALDLANSHINLAEVNCEKDKELCSAQKVAGLPTLKFYHGGSTFVYADDRALENFKNYVTKMTGPALHALDHSSLPSVYEHAVSVVYIHQKGDNLDTITSVAKKYLDTVPFYVTTDQKVMTALNRNNNNNNKRAVIILKDGGAVQQIFDGDMEHDLSEWVHNNKYPLVTRINAGNANGILKGDRLVVLMFTSDDESNGAFRSVAKQWISTTTSSKDGGDGAPSVVFAELNGRIWEKYVKRVYDVSSNQLPAIVIMDPTDKVYFNQDLQGMPFSVDRPTALFDALKQTNQLESHTTDVARALSTMQKVVNYVGDHYIYFGAALLCLIVAAMTLASSSGGQVQPSISEEKKKDD
ncbi:hypothetical protein BCR42DRAFT_457235 [Absidia repens]|uniref:Thioredoxin domain-containing protein n=1 Tax=Absidia repens TaxID=90262 RepID=A0A1X2HXD6_9FUNG|nr:hypothetical protein BCR42DRAFT_457235 [Absidia repens]